MKYKILKICLIMYTPWKPWLFVFIFPLTGNKGITPSSLQTNTDVFANSAAVLNEHFTNQTVPTVTLDNNRTVHFNIEIIHREAIDVLQSWTRDILMSWWHKQYNATKLSSELSYPLCELLKSSLSHSSALFSNLGRRLKLHPLINTKTHLNLRFTGLYPF